MPGVRIVVDQDVCTGQAMCESIAPDLFLVAGGQAEIQVAVAPDGRLSQARPPDTLTAFGAEVIAPLSRIGLPG